MKKTNMSESSLILARFIGMAVLSAVLIAVSGPLYYFLRSLIPEKELPVLKDGSYTWTAENPDASGFMDQVSLTVTDGAITACSWDCITEDGITKSTLSMEGKYIMTENGALWHEQAAAVAGYVISHQGATGLANSDGYVDGISSVSINVRPFLNGLEHCLEQAGQ